MIDDIETVTPETLVAAVEAFKADGRRLVGLTCSEVDETRLDLLYHFDKDLALSHLRMEVDKGARLPSISDIYFAAFLGENEIQDQFGLTFEGLAIDFKGGLMLEGEARNSPLCRFTVVEEGGEA